MNRRYSHILTFTCKHEYFGEKIFKTLEFSYETETRELMKNLGVIVKPFKGGFHLLSSNPELLKASGNETSFQFYFNSNDPYYINYSELSAYNPGDDLLYFDNLNKSSDSNQYSLHVNEFIERNDVVELSHGNIRIPSFNETKRYLIKDARNVIISDESLLKSVSNPAEISLMNTPKGLINIYENNEKVSSVYYYPVPVWKKPLGTIDIFTDTLYQQFESSGKLEYSINFNNKKTIWKYFLTNSFYQKFKNLCILNKDKEPIFNPPEKIQIEDDTTALVFESKQQIPLKEHSENTLQLIDNFNPEFKSGKVIIKHLNQASAEQLFQDALPNNKSNYSHIYIN